MKNTSRLVILSGLLLGLSLPSITAETAPDPSWGKASDNKVCAQQLVNQTMAAHPELLVIGMHATKPGSTDQRMLASNLDRIGKHDDDDDIGVATEHKTICAPNLKETFKFEVLMPLKDASGQVLKAAIGFVFKYQAGDDEVKMHAKAVAIRDALAKQTPSLEALFAPVEKL